MHVSLYNGWQCLCRIRICLIQYSRTLHIYKHTPTKTQVWHIINSIDDRVQLLIRRAFTRKARQKQIGTRTKRQGVCVHALMAGCFQSQFVYVQVNINIFEYICVRERVREHTYFLANASKWI